MMGADDDEELPKLRPHWEELPDKWNSIVLVPAFLFGMMVFGGTFNLVLDWWEEGGILPFILTAWGALIVGGAAMLGSFWLVTLLLWPLHRWIEYRQLLQLRKNRMAARMGIKKRWWQRRWRRR